MKGFNSSDTSELYAVIGSKEPEHCIFCVQGKVK